MLTIHHSIAFEITHVPMNEGIRIEILFYNAIITGSIIIA